MSCLLPDWVIPFLQACTRVYCTAALVQDYSTPACVLDGFILTFVLLLVTSDVGLQVALAVREGNKPLPAGASEVGRIVHSMAELP